MKRKENVEEQQIVTLANIYLAERLCDHPPLDVSDWRNNGGSLNYGEIAFVVDRAKGHEPYIKIITSSGRFGWIRESVIDYV